MTANLVARVENLSVAFGGAKSVAQPIVRNVSFDVYRGKTLAIVGESGSGKSVTSLSMMRLVELGGGRIVSGSMHLYPPAGAAIDLARASEAQMRPLRGSAIGMIFQEPMTSLNPVFRVGAQLVEAIRLHQPGSRAEAQAQALRMLDLVRIPDAHQVMGRFPHQLSGGMRQRMMIAMALASKPALLIADEPTTALDVTVQSQILQLVRELQDEMEMGVVIITHDMGVVAQVADEVMVMRRGEAVERGPVEQIFSAPEHEYTQALLAAVPRLGSMTGTDAPAKFPLLGDGRTNDVPVPPAAAARATSEPLLRVRDLTIRYDLRGGIWGGVQKRVHAVEGIDFDLFAGETLALVGESGCGKSTTARAVAGLTGTQGGTIEFQGRPLAGLRGADKKQLCRDIQVVFQDPYAALDPRRSIEDTLLEPLQVHGICRGDDARQRVVELLERVGLPASHAQRYPHQFSGGQRQRICIARALALSPKLVVADESVSALDVSIQAQIVNLLQDLQRDLGVAFLFISHDLAVVERVSHRVAVMYQGRIVEIGTRRQIFETPQHAYTRKLLDAVPHADPAARTARVDAVSGDLPSRVFGLSYKPERVGMIQVAPGHFVAAAA